MTYTIIIHSIGHKNEIEWTENIEALTKSAARTKATKWIKHNLFDSDYDTIEKDKTDLSREYWTIR